MNAKMQTPRNPQIRLAADKGFKGVFQRRLRERMREREYSRPQSRLPSLTVAPGRRGHERR